MRSADVKEQFIACFTWEVRVSFFKNRRIIYFVPAVGAKNCDERVCLSVGLHISNTTCQTSRNFPCTLSVVTALSSSDINALPILWMTPCLLIIGYKLRGWYGVSLTVTHQGVVPGAKSWSRYDCFVSVKISAEIRLQPNSPTVYVIARPTGTFYGQSLPERSDFRTAVTNAVYATVQWWRSG